MTNTSFLKGQEVFVTVHQENDVHIVIGVYIGLLQESFAEHYLVEFGTDGIRVVSQHDVFRDHISALKKESKIRGELLNSLRSELREEKKINEEHLDRDKKISKAMDMILTRMEYLELWAKKRLIKPLK